MFPVRNIPPHGLIIPKRPVPIGIYRNIVNKGKPSAWICYYGKLVQILLFGLAKVKYPVTFIGVMPLRISRIGPHLPYFHCATSEKINILAIVKEFATFIDF